MKVSTGPSSGAQTDTKAILSLIFGILSLTILWILAGIPAVILGHMSRSSIRKRMGELKGEGMALAGLIMGYISIATLPLILIIATIAIPSLLRARQVAQESSAVAQLRTINSAEVTYLAEHHGEYGTISQLVREGLLDERFAEPVAGYRFTVAAAGNEYIAMATPVSPNTGRYGYMSTADAIVRYQQFSTASCIPCFPSGKAGSPVEQALLCTLPLVTASSH